MYNIFIKYCKQAIVKCKGELNVSAERRFDLDPYHPDNAGMGIIWIFGLSLYTFLQRKLFYWMILQWSVSL